MTVDALATLHREAANTFPDNFVANRKSKGPFRSTELAAYHLLIKVINGDNAARRAKVAEQWRRSQPRELNPPTEDPINIANLPPGTFSIDLPFTLQSDLLCKDDAQFHPLDNPLKKDRVHGYPEYWGPSWKGILRQAFLAGHEIKLDPEATAQDLRLFGSPKNTHKDLRSGRLRFFTTRFDKIGFIVLHPSARTPKTPIPILYETVPANTTGHFRLLYCPWDAVTPDPAEIESDAAILVAAIKDMFTLGVGAKSSAGFGAAFIQTPAIDTVGLPPAFAKNLSGWLVTP